MWKTLASGKQKSPARGKKRDKATTGTAEQPGQTVNVDLCFVPATHEGAAKLPAVSGSSGRLIVERPQAEATEREWPGCVFEDPELTYEEAMLDFVAASQERAHQPEPESKEEFIHVLIARHRPQSNGIAERFARTLKEWLEDKSWRDDQELAELLQR